MKDILTAITELREQRNWTEYQLAERSGYHSLRSLRGFGRV